MSNKKQSICFNKNYKSIEDYPDVLNVSELAQILRVHISTAYGLLHSGAIPYRRIGSAYRISKRALLQFLNLDDPALQEERDGKPISEQIAII